MAAFESIQQGLRDSDSAAARGSVAALIELAHSLGVNTQDRRDDAPVFVAGTEPIETATWAQCGGLLFALSRDEVPDARAIAQRVGRRVCALAQADIAWRAE